MPFGFLERRIDYRVLDDDLLHLTLLSG
jgi:hypothetical protein